MKVDTFTPEKGRISVVALAEIARVGGQHKLRAGGPDRCFSDYTATLNWLLPEEEQIKGSDPYTRFIEKCEEVYHNLLRNPHEYRRIVEKIEKMEHSLN
ncbi:MAG: hypothetical protein Q4B28_06280 [bacterium]|nr:hypothetical protein [bacterium]